MKTEIRYINLDQIYWNIEGMKIAMRHIKNEEDKTSLRFLISVYEDGMPNDYKPNSIEKI